MINTPRKPPPTRAPNTATLPRPPQAAAQGTPVAAGSSTRTHRVRLCHLLFPAFLFSCFPAFLPAAETAPLRAAFHPHERLINNYRDQFPLLQIRSARLAVDFVPRTFWTVALIHFDGKVVNQLSGATGAVIHWDGEAIGTGHRGKLRSEVLQSVTLAVDGKAIDLVRDGKEVDQKNLDVTGKTMTLLKHSTIGPLRHQARFDFDAAGHSYLVTHHFEVIEPITAERFRGYRYAFMQMMPKNYHRWARFNDAGIEAEGETARLDPASQSKKQVFAFSDLPMKALACYAPDLNLGVAYVYPRTYPGTNHYLDRHGKDNKFRGILFEKDAYNVGEKMTWRMRVVPFDADSDNWKQTAAAIVAAPWPPEE